MDRAVTRRWIKTSLRTLHLLAVAGVGGGVLFGLETERWLDYWVLALATGGLMMLMDMISNRAWIAQIRGLVIVLKLVLLALMVFYPAWSKLLLVAIIIISAVISHAPGELRYYSIYHRRVINSPGDTKG